MNSDWHGRLRQRFADREDIGKHQLYKLYFSGLPKSEVLECLNLIELELGIPAGLLRPSDNLNLLFEPIQTQNPFKWMVYQVRSGDRQGAISIELSEKLRDYGTFDDWKVINTVEDLIRAWCGQKP